MCSWTFLPLFVVRTHSPCCLDNDNNYYYYFSLCSVFIRISFGSRFVLCMHSHSHTHTVCWKLLSNDSDKRIFYSFTLNVERCMMGIGVAIHRPNGHSKLSRFHNKFVFFFSISYNFFYENSVRLV